MIQNCLSRYNMDDSYTFNIEHRCVTRHLNKRMLELQLFFFNLSVDSHPLKTTIDYLYVNTIIKIQKESLTVVIFCFYLKLYLLYSRNIF